MTKNKTKQNRISEDCRKAIKGVTCEIGIAEEGEIGTEEKLKKITEFSNLMSDN